MDDWTCFVRSLADRYGFQPQPTQEEGVMVSWTTPLQHDPGVEIPSKDPRSEACYDCQESAAGEHGTRCNDKIPVPSQPDSPTSVLLVAHEQCNSSTNTSTVNINHVEANKLLVVNTLLSHSGFPPLKSPLTEDQLLDTLIDLVRDYTRRESFVQELLEQSEECRKAAERNDAQLSKMETEIQVCKRKLASSEQRAHTALSAADKLTLTLRKELQSLETNNSSLLQRCSQLEHNCRSRERDAQRYQSKLLEAIQKDEHQRLKDLECYKTLKNKVMRARHARGDIVEQNLLFRDLKPMQLVSIYEKQKLGMASEIDALRSQVASLCQELQDRENEKLPDGRDSNSLLEKLCRKLDLENPTYLLNAVESLLTVNAAVPFLEEFVEEVCNVVLIAGKDFLPRSNEENPREVPNILKSWLKWISASRR